MDEFSVISDHSVLLQGRGMFGAGLGAVAFAAGHSSDVPASQGNVVRMQDERKNKGKLICDWPEPVGFEDLETQLRTSNPTFEIGSDYFDEPLCSSICSPEAQLVPTGYFDSIDFSIDGNGSKDVPLFVEPSVSVSDATCARPPFLNQTRMTDLTDTQRQSRSDGRDAPLNYEARASCSSEENGQFSKQSDAEIFCLFDDIATEEQIGDREGLEAIFRSNKGMQVPSASGTLCSDETVPSASCSGTDLGAAHIPSARKPHDPLHGTPDMILKEMAENPLEMYFPPLSTYEQPEILTSATPTQTYPSFPGEFAGSGVPSCVDLQFLSKETTSEASEQPCSTLILEAVPVKDLGFHKLQEGMNQLDVATKGRIRDALYRLANRVEQSHCAATASGGVGSSGSRRFTSSKWAKTQMNPMDETVAQLLLQKKALYRKTVLSHRVT